MERVERGPLIELSREECIALLRSVPVGRLALSTRDGTPIIRPVNFGYDERSQSVVFRTAAGSKLHALLHSRKAAFEVDGFDAEARSGWSVIVLGAPEDVTAPAEVRRLESLGVEPWAAGEKPNWVRIRARTVSGRRIVAVQAPAGEVLVSSP